MARVKRKRSKPAVPAPGGERRLCLDISSRCVGWAVFEGSTLTDQGKLILGLTASHAERLWAMGEWLDQQFLQYTPKHLFFEQPFAGRQRNAYGVLMLYVGVVLSRWYAYAGVPLPDECRIPARAVKRVLGLKHLSTHEARKRQMVLEINRLYGMKLRYKRNDPGKKVSDDDVADAIAVGRVSLLQEGMTLS